MDAALASSKVADLAVLGDPEEFVELLLLLRKLSLLLELFVSSAGCGYFVEVVLRQRVALEADSDQGRVACHLEEEKLGCFFAHIRVLQVQLVQPRLNFLELECLIAEAMQKVEDV